MKRLALISSLALAVTLLAYLAPAATPQDDTPFTLKPGCKLPFDDIKTEKLGVDRYCGPAGKSSSSAASRAQNQAKNNFCVTGTPLTINFKTFDDLMTATRQKQIPFGQAGMPQSRAPLAAMITISGKQVGEGMLVTLEGNILETHHADTYLDQFGGESVNCNKNAIEWNDIHIALVDPAGPSNPCSSVTAEISPHFRPASWNRFITRNDEFKIENGLPIQGARVRISGQLFFDASHGPCNDPNKKSSDPPRRSIWEIHPVYAIEIFDTTKNKFVALDTWAKDK